MTAPNLTPNGTIQYSGNATDNVIEIKHPDEAYARLALKADGSVVTGNGTVPGFATLSSAQEQNPRAYGSLGDGTGTSLSSIFSTLAAAQIVYPFATSLSNTLDECGIIAAIKACGSQGTVRIPDGTYISSSFTYNPPSGVNFLGNGPGTVFTPTSGFVGPVLEITKESNGAVHPEFHTQGWRHRVGNFSIIGAGIVAGQFNAGAIADPRSRCDGIWMHDTDWVQLEPTIVYGLKGYGLKCGPVLRESDFQDLHIFRCGSASNTLSSLLFTNSASPADQNNTLNFYNAHVVYSDYALIENDDTGSSGSRLIWFFGGQLEAGGYGGSPGTLMSTGNGPLSDGIILRNVDDIHFVGTWMKNSVNVTAANGPNSGNNWAVIRAYGSALNSLPVQEITLTACNVQSGTYDDVLNLDQVQSVTIAGSNHIHGAANTTTPGPVTPTPATVRTSPTLTSQVVRINPDTNIGGPTDNNGKSTGTGIIGNSSTTGGIYNPYTVADVPFGQLFRGSAYLASTRNLDAYLGDLFWDGTNWQAPGFGGNNGASMIGLDKGNGAIRFYSIKRNASTGRTFAPGTAGGEMDGQQVAYLGWGFQGFGGGDTYTGDFGLNQFGGGLRIREGTNCKQGIVTLISGTATVNNAILPADARIFLTAQDDNTVGSLRVSARITNTSFTITSSSLTDSGVVAYEIFLPS